MFQQRRLRNDRTNSSWADNAADRNDGVEENRNQIAHWQMLTDGEISSFQRKLEIRQGQDEGYRYIIHDRDRIYSRDFDASLETLGLDVLGLPINRRR